jgi:hypothetical protein
MVLMIKTGRTYSEGPVMVRAMLRAANIYRSMGQNDMAIKCYRRAMTFNPPMQGFLNARIDKLQQAKQAKKNIEK